MSFVFHLRRVKSLPKSIPSLGIWLTLFVLFLIGKGQQSNAQETTRIFSGTAARKGRYPYMCSLRKEAFGLHICGGALINKDWMITAAHCVDPNDAKSAGLRPYAYCDIFESRDRDPSKRFKTSCRLHHMWNSNFGNDGDIALCKLDKSTGLPIPQLASIGETIVDGSIFSVLGWGKTSSRNEVADTLQIGENLKYVSNSACNAGRKLSITIIDSMVCAGDGSVDTCLGDSGGPLLEPNKRNNPLAENPELDLIVGITSFGSEACRGAPGVYARISCYRQWIDCVIQGKGQDCNVHIPCEEKSDPCSGVSRNSTFDEANALIRIERALQSDDSELVKEILCQGLNSNAVFKGFNHSLLIRAAQHDAVKSAQVLLQQGTNLEYKNSFGQTALSRAARYGSARVAQLFIDKRANIESKTNIGWTALYYAARYNHLQIAQILIENGAKLESKSNIGWTPLHTASEHNSLAVAKVLIIAGANINSKQDSGWTPLHLAAEEGSLEVAKELIAAGADLSSRTNNGSTPLHLTAQFNSVEVVKELIASGADLSSRTNKGHTPLHTAAQFNSIEIAKELIAAGSDISSRTNKGFTPLHLAAQFNSVQIVRELLSKNAELEARTNFGDTPLQIASYHGSFDVLQMLLDKEAIVESVNNKKQTPLHYASSRGHASVVRVLLLNGASKTSTDDDGKTPLDVICTNKFLDRPCTNNIINAIRSLLET